jgi:hypothetical protein
MIKYGKAFDSKTGSLDVELYCFRHDPRADYEGGRLSSWDHYKNAVDIIFNNKESIRPHVWTDWSELMIREVLGERENQRFLGIAGGGSSGKSDELGLFVLMHLIAAPTQTFCYVTSLTLDTAQQRIWKCIREYEMQARHYFESKRRRPPFEALHSKCRIRGLAPDGSYTNAAGIFLVAADKRKGDDEVGKMRGTKVPMGGWLIVVADELAGLSESVVNVAKTNLTTNERLLFVAMSQPNQKLDAFGKLMKPLDGWDIMKREPMDWRIDRGKAIRLDMSLSPRIKEEAIWTEEEKKEKTPRAFWMPSSETIQKVANTFGGTRSRQYLSEIRGLFAADKDPNAIYSENELIEASEAREPEWDNPRALVPICGLDSAFTTGGDRTVSVEALCGRVNGRPHMHITGFQVFELKDNKGTSQQSLIRSWLRRSCTTLGMDPKHMGYDHSGGGVSFGHLVDIECVSMGISPVIRKVDFGGRPTGEKYNLDGDTKYDYAYLIDELWISPKQAIRSKQITGICPEIVEELVMRQYDQGYGGHKLRIEPKRKLKARIGKSCDLADAFVICHRVAVLNGLLDSAEEKAIIGKARRDWRASMSKFSFRGRKTKHMKF